ncbi:MAG TPA: SGNH/GDSL hydrolase family protein [Candidatus Limnocylindria bacterium]|nr:SGNH/GDSL hydrolase family protein [Candidatus Limnocylindria bacterium]
MLTIAVFGDSLGRGVFFDEGRGRYAILKDGFDRLMEGSGVARFINRSRFGATAAEGLAAFEEDPPLDADAVAIEFGGNDCTPDWKAASEDPLTLHPARVGLEEFERTLSRFVGRVRDLGKVPVLVTPVPLVSERFVPWISRGLDAGAILRFLGDVHRVYRWHEQYALAIHKVARLTRCNLFDLRAWFLKERELGSLYCVDGMHPNGEGHRVIAHAAASDLPLLPAGPSVVS